MSQWGQKNFLTKHPLFSRLSQSSQHLLSCINTLPEQALDWILVGLVEDEHTELLCYTCTCNREYPIPLTSHAASHCHELVASSSRAVSLWLRSILLLKVERRWVYKPCPEYGMHNHHNKVKCAGPSVSLTFTCMLMLLCYWGCGQVLENTLFLQYIHVSLLTLTHSICE